VSGLPVREPMHVCVHVCVLGECNAVWWQPMLRLPRLMGTAASEWLPHTVCVCEVLVCVCMFVCLCLCLCLCLGLGCLCLRSVSVHV
jgi:hypothetical protein